jgi:cytochrome bd-type quinol oxidase subunit 2
MEENTEVNNVQQKEVLKPAPLLTVDKATKIIHRTLATLIIVFLVYCIYLATPLIDTTNEVILTIGLAIMFLFPVLALCSFIIAIAFRKGKHWGLLLTLSILLPIAEIYIFLNELFPSL